MAHAAYENYSRFVDSFQQFFKFLSQDWQFFLDDAPSDCRVHRVVAVNKYISKIHDSLIFRDPLRHLGGDIFRNLVIASPITSNCRSTAEQEQVRFQIFQRLPINEHLDADCGMLHVEK